MRHFLTGFSVLLLSGAVCAQQPGATPAADAQAANAALEQKVRDLEDRMALLEGQLRQLKAQQMAPQPPATQPQTPGEPATVATAPAPPLEPVRLGGAGASAAKALNPDISVIGDFISTGGRNRISPSPAFEMHESEIGLQAIIDPYARADFFISFGEQGVNLEEGFITFTALPKGFLAKVGKMRSAFGKVNTMHNHVLPWVDRPLVTRNLVGGEDGIDDAGFSVQHIIPIPGKWFVELTGQGFRGDSSDVFKSSTPSDLSTVSHLRGYRDITDNTNVDLGLSYSRGHNQFGSAFVSSLYGVDATWRWKPLQRSIYHQFLARSEFIWRQQQQPTLGQCTLVTCPPDGGLGFQRAFGFYTSADYQFARRWFAGARYDDSDRATNARLHDRGGAALLTYWPSEFAQIRGQYRFTRYTGNSDAHEVLFQILFALGAHGAHPF
ncbi:MAG TPA: hypothetical protein VNW97_18605 [Candidatus Saccharimonadales bacterium]|jgi:hypothetical protein|nr:hypothetical protein [Candidatus Saccharimonadales bacterium]